MMKTKRVKRAPNYKAPALEKGLDILEFLSASNSPQTLSEVALGLKRTSSQIFRMLLVLERRGYVFRDQGSGKYDLSLKLYSIARSHHYLDLLLKSSRRPMKDLGEQLCESCYLAVLDGKDLLILAATPAPGPLLVHVKLGGRMPWGDSTSGRLLAAFMAADQRRRQLGVGTTAELREIAARGWIAERSPTHPGVRTLAVPVRLPAGWVALGIVSIEARNQPLWTEEIVAACRKAAARISEAMGFPPA